MYPSPRNRRNPPTPYKKQVRVVHKRDDIKSSSSTPSANHHRTSRDITYESLCIGGGGGGGYLLQHNGPICYRSACHYIILL